MSVTSTGQPATQLPVRLGAPRHEADRVPERPAGGGPVALCRRAAALFLTFFLSSVPAQQPQHETLIVTRAYEPIPLEEADRSVHLENISPARWLLPRLQRMHDLPRPGHMLDPGELHPLDVTDDRDLHVSHLEPRLRFNRR